MNSFFDKMNALGASDIFPICRTELIDEHARYGFVNLGAWGSEHVGLSWSEMP